MAEFDLMGGLAALIRGCQLEVMIKSTTFPTLLVKFNAALRLATGKELQHHEPEDIALAGAVTIGALLSERDVDGGSMLLDAVLLLCAGRLVHNDMFPIADFPEDDRCREVAVLAAAKVLKRDFRSSLERAETAADQAVDALCAVAAAE
jgi:hypothetical protein